jgi:very-short-patch-repair endonuclease
MSELADSRSGNRPQTLPRDLIVARLAGAQDGVVSLKQLQTLGLSASAVKRSLRSGRLHLVLPGVYAVGHSLLSWRGKLRAALLWAGPDALLSHVTAATLWELLRSATTNVHITVPRGGKTSRAWVRVHHTRQLAPAEVNGFPVTTVERTLADIAPEISQDRLEQAIEQAARMNKLDFSALQGPKKLRSLIAQFDPLAPQTNPGIERAFLKLVRKYGLPQPQANVQVGPYVVDFLWPDHKLIVELDSLQHHRRPSVFEADRKRDIYLKRLGYTVLRVTHRRLKEEPAVVAQEISYFLSACGP